MSHNIIIKFLIVLILSVLFFTSCQTGVEDSPSPAILEVVLRTNANDTYYVDRGDTFSVFTPFETIFNMNVFQGTIYSGPNFAILFNSLTSYRQQDSVYNVLTPDFDKSIVSALLYQLEIGDTTLDKIQPESLAKFCENILALDDGRVNIDDLSMSFKEFKVFESYIPPGKYDSLKIGFNAPNDIQLNRIKLVARSGKTFFIPLELPPGENLLMNFPINAELVEGGRTRITLEIFPFQSIYRYRDLYRLQRKVEVVSVETL